MDETISAADANRQFSRLMRGVREGHTYVVTSHGKPIARIVPADAPDDAAVAARQALLTRLEKKPIVHIGRWSRDELYDDQ